MSIKLDDLETFKKHRNKISESLTSEFVGRQKEINDICNLLSQKDFVAITGSAGIGKSRLAVAAIEKYVSENKNITVLCVKSFGDYISAIEDSIEDSKKYLFFIDDANDYKKLGELIECLNYCKQDNVKAVFTVRDYLKDCIDDESIVFYEVRPLNNKEIKEVIKENTPIKSDKWLNKIADISKGNVRLASIIADVALKDEKDFASLFNVQNIMNSFYKEQIAKMNGSSNLLITAGIISFFRTTYLNQLFYISPILKLAGITKQEFLHYVDTLISMELVDECVGVVKISDQCFADYLLNYVFIEKKYIKIKDLIVSTYKYYEKRIVESLNAILSTCLTDDSVSYLKNELLNSYSSIEDIELKNKIEVAFAPLTLDHAAMEFKNGVESYSDKKDIGWLLELFKTLAKTEYQSVANEGIMRLLKKTGTNKIHVFKAIDDAYSLDYDSVRSSFVYLDSFVCYLIDHRINDEPLLLLVSSYLKYSFRDSRFIGNKRLEFCAFNVRDDMSKIIPFRRKCWDYIFEYGKDKSLDAIIDFAKYHIAEDNQKIMQSDLEAINKHLENLENKDLIYAVLCEEFKDDAKNYNFENMLYSSAKHSDILKIILEKPTNGQNYETFEKSHEENVKSFYVANKSNIFEKIRNIDLISNYYAQDIKNFLSILIHYLDEFSSSILSVFVRYKVHPLSVVEKASSIVELETLYNEIKSIDDSTMREEYLYAFYSYINSQNNENLFGFETWIKSKQDLDTKPIFGRNLLSLRQISENSGISYVKLVKIILKKRQYNDVIAKEYLSCMFFKENAFKELLNLDRDLAIAIYEFLIDHAENDYKNKALKEIISLKRNYIKTFAIRYLDAETIDENGLDEIIFDDDNYKLFFDTCINAGKEKLPYFFPLNLQRFVSHHLGNQKMLDWIEGYIDKNRNDNKAMESLFSVLARIDDKYKNGFIIKYYERGKDEEVLKCALSNVCVSYSLNSAESYLTIKIKNLASLKASLIKWDNLNLVSFINELIEGYKEDIKNSKVSKLIEYVDPSLLNELQEIDVKTEISLVDAFRLYSEDENFRRLLSSGYVAYKDGCFVTKSNVPLKFVDVLKDKKILGIKTIQANGSEKEKYEKYLSSLRIIEKIFNDKKIATLDECLAKLFDERGWSVEDFERKTFLSRDIFSKIKNNKRNNLQKITIIKILIGLKLSKTERDFLLELNNTQLSEFDKNDVQYSFILDSKIDIGMADELLKKLGKDGF